MRRDAIANQPAKPGTLARALASAHEAGITASQLQDFFDNAFMVPVPHRPSDGSTAQEHHVARDGDCTSSRASRRQEWSPDEETEIEDKIRRAVLILWQTSLLRRTKLNVRDEVSNGLAYYDYTFLREVPRLYQQVERQSVLMMPRWKRRR